MFRFRGMLAFAALAGAMPSIAEAQGAADSLLARVDHLVFATPDLNRGVDEIERLLGIRASAGGPHPGRGTRNALVALGPHTYLEIMAPDPDQPPPSTPRPFGLDLLTHSRLVAWALMATILSNFERQPAETVSN